MRFQFDTKFGWFQLQIAVIKWNMEYFEYMSKIKPNAYNFHNSQIPIIWYQFWCREWQYRFNFFSHARLTNFALNFIRIRIGISNTKKCLLSIQFENQPVDLNRCIVSVIQLAEIAFNELKFWFEINCSVKLT